MDVIIKTTIDEVKTGKKGLAFKLGTVKCLSGGAPELMAMCNEAMDVTVTIRAIPVQPELFDGDEKL